MAVDLGSLSWVIHHLTVLKNGLLLLDGGVLDPLPDLGPEVSLVDVRKEFDAFEGINLGLFALIALQSEQNHAQDRP